MGALRQAGALHTRLSICWGSLRPHHTEGQGELHPRPAASSSLGCSCEGPTSAEDQRERQGPRSEL